MRYTLRQIEVFIATARHEHLSRAADSLAMSQSAASAALADLEHQFDIRLFDRIGKRVQLNERGRDLLPAAEELIERAREIESRLAGRGTVGSLRVGATLSIGNYLAVPIMTRFMDEHPGATISLDVGNTAAIVRKILQFELDVGLIEGEVQHAALEVIPWRDDELVVFCSPQHALARRRRLDDAHLRAARWILREPGSGTRQTFDRAMSGLLSDLDVVLELQHTEAIKRAVEAGTGIGCLSRETLADSFARGSLVPLRVPQRDLTRRFYFILHRQKYRSAAIEAWLEACRNAG